jgi:predicted transcriptional regulator
MNQKRFFSPAEWEILQFITMRQTATGREVADHFASTRGWARTTVITMIERLRDKGYLLRDESGNVHRYAPSEPKADLMRGLVRDFVQKALGGSVSPFFAYLGDEADLSAEDVAELRKVLHELDTKEDRDDG